MDGKALAKLVRKLQILAPAMYPISIGTRKISEGWYGSCQIINRKDTKRIKISINSFESFSREELVEILQTQVLIHEYAHAVQWRPTKQEEDRESDHDSEFGIHYARIYKLLGMAD